MTEHMENRSIRKATVKVRRFSAAFCLNGSDLEIDMHGSLNTLSAPVFLESSKR